MTFDVRALADGGMDEYVHFSSQQKERRWWFLVGLLDYLGCSGISERKKKPRNAHSRASSETCNQQKQSANL